MVLGIFLFNLGASAFAVVTLPGIAVFPLSVGFLLFRAVLWGLMLGFLPNWVLLTVLPTVILEGEAYVFACVGGVVVGASWVRPSLMYREGNLSRMEALRMGFWECLKLYVFVCVFLFAAAVVETATLLLIIS